MFSSVSVGCLEIVFHLSLLTRFDFIPQNLGWLSAGGLHVCKNAALGLGPVRHLQSQIADLIADFSLRGVGRARQRIHQLQERFGLTPEKPVGNETVNSAPGVQLSWARWTND
jgi:hypothetical protein